MKSDKILNILIAFFITMIIMNLFFPSPKKAEVVNDVVFTSQSKSFTIPNVPKVSIKNDTAKEFKFNTCKDLEIFKDSSKLENIATKSPTFCNDVVVKSKETKNIDFEGIAYIFKNSGEYNLKIKKDSKEYIANFTESEKGYFNTVFSTLFYQPVYNLFVLFLSKLPNHSLGLTIILVTLIIRMIVLVPQHKMMVNSKKMQKIQPKIKEIQEKYKGDQAKIGMELLEIYKREKVNPMGSCLPMMLQLPLLIVLYWVVSGITSSENYYYLYQGLSTFSVKEINVHFLGLNLVQQEWKSGLLLAILIGGFQWLQIKMSMLVHEKKKKNGKIVEKDVKTDDPISEFMPDPDAMNFFMLWGMPTMLAFSSFYFPSGVGIYWLIGTVFTLIQQYIVNKLGEKEEIVTSEGHDIIIPEKKKKRV